MTAELCLSQHTKVCTTCGEGKPATLEHFTRQRAGKYGVSAKCKICARATTREWQQSERGRAARLAYRARPDVKEKERQADREKWANNPERRERKAQTDKARNSTPEIRARRAAQKRERRRTDPEFAAKERERSMSQSRREWRRQWQAKYFKDRASIDPQFKLRLRVGSAVREYLQARGCRKGGRKWETLLGYTAAELKKHLERQFVKGMTWENHGTAWHIDHIIPDASFNYTSAEDPEFAAAWAITNLRPLWAKQNILKGAKRLLLL